MKSDLVDITMHVHHKTDRAVLASDDGNSENAVWLPLAQVEIVLTEEPLAEITMPEWMAVEKELV